jgi:hypothetical protein
MMERRGEESAMHAAINSHVVSVPLKEVDC